MKAETLGIAAECFSNRNKCVVLRQHLLLWKCRYLCELNKQQFILIGGGGALAREGLSAPLRVSAPYHFCTRAS